MLITSAMVLADRRRALPASLDKTLRLWDLETGAKLRRFEGHEEKIGSTIILGDGWRALSGSDDGTLRLWDLEAGVKPRRFKRPEEFRGVPKTRMQDASSSSWDRTLRLWDFEIYGGPPNWTIVIERVGERHELSRSYDDDNTLVLRDRQTSAELSRFKGHKDRISSTIVLGDGRRALSGSWDSTLRLWDLETGAELRRFDGHKDRIISTIVLPDGRHALSGSYERTLRLWNLETGEELRRFDGHERAVTTLIVLANGQRALSGSLDKTLRLWDLETGAELTCLTFDAALRTIAWSTRTAAIFVRDGFGLTHVIKLLDPVPPAPMPYDAAGKRESVRAHRWPTRGRVRCIVLGTDVRSYL